MKRKVEPVYAFEGQGRLGKCDPSGVRVCVQIFVTLLAQRLIPPGLIVAQRMKGGPVCADRDFATGWNCRIPVAKSDPVVEQSERDGNAAISWCIALQPDRHLGMLVADGSLLPPRLLPAGVRRPSIHARYGAVMGVGLTNEIETQIRWRQDRLTQ